ncbi:MAG: hypothetical protein R6U10_04710 [Thermoplasmatota archaeon]
MLVAHVILRAGDMQHRDAVSFFQPSVIPGIAALPPGGFRAAGRQMLERSGGRHRQCRGQQTYDKMWFHGYAFLTMIRTRSIF